MSKRDRQGARTPADLVQRYNLGDVTAVMGAAADARTAANEARNAAANLNNSLTPSTIFTLLTNYGQSKFIYKGEDGEIYINASYITGFLDAALLQGTLDASVVKIVNFFAEALRSVAGNSQLDISNAKISLASAAGETFGVANVDDYHAYIGMKRFDETGNEVGQSQYGADRLQIGGTLEEPKFGVFVKEDGSVAIRLPDGEMPVSWKDNGDGTFTLTGTQLGDSDETEAPETETPDADETETVTP